MNDLPRQRLCEIIAQYGHSLCDEPRRCEGFLRDFCGEYKGEINALVSALKERVADDLLASSPSVPQEVLLARLTARLRNNLALAEDAARWAVESWALAFGLISHAELSRPKPGAPSPTPPPVTRPTSVTELTPYTLKPGLTISTLKDLPAVCDQVWDSAVEHFVKGYITERMESRLAILRAKGRYDKVSKIEPLVLEAQTLRQQAVQGDEITRSAALEAFLQAIGQALGGVSAPHLTVSQDKIDLGTVEQGNLVIDELTVTNSTRGYLTGTVSSDATWLAITPTRFGCVAGDQVVVKAKANTVNLSSSSPCEEHHAKIVIASNGGVYSVAICVCVGRPVLTVSPEKVEFGTLVNRASGQQWLQISNDGLYVLTGQLRASKPWLKLAPTGFRCSSGETVRIKMEAQTNTLKAGTHKAEVEVTSNAGEQSVPVKAQVVLLPELAVEPKRLHFNLTTGRQTLRLGNIGCGVSRVRLTSPTWLIVEPTELEVNEGQSGEASVRVHFGLLDSQASQSEVTVTSGNAQERVGVEVDGKSLPPQKSGLGWELKDPDGKTYYARSEDKLRAFLARECWINDEIPRRPITELRPKMRLYGVVKETYSHGAVVDIGAETDGLLHISQLSPTRVSRVIDIVQPGDSVTVWVIKVDPALGHVGLTMIGPSEADRPKA